MADSAQTGGAYLTVTNTDTADVTIVGAESARANTTTLHESSEHDGMMHMMPKTSIRVPKDSTVRMTPGGLHVMLEGLTAALHAGDSLSVTLLLQDGRRIPVPVRVRNE
ncbi:MAG: copper chaperone PCu(A)C [Gemmatimonadaceae bacterium]|nr:copper chaperone PCu(A)C [Gemmatimonadaceae bacterium]